MYCVIQEVKIKKIPRGEAKEIEVYSLPWTFDGEKNASYGYKMSDESYERTIDTAYRISIHQSYRENGKVKKKQVYICTIGYYNIIDWSDWIKDYVDSSRWEQILQSLNISEDRLIEIIYGKWKLISEKVSKEFDSSPEGKAKLEHKHIIGEYNRRIELFMQEYETTRDEYTKCYDVFGVLRNPEYLEKIKQDYQNRKEYERNSRSYQEKFYRNYNQSDSNRSYLDYEINNYSNEEKEMLKQFYRVLSKKFHPDANTDMDTSKQMKLLNQLKADWKI